MSEKYLPIKIFEKRKDYDDRSTEGGGDSHEGSWVLHGEELNKRVDYLSKNVNTIQDSFQKWKENKRALPMIISTTVIDKAIAKTHRGRIVNLLENDGKDNVIGVYGDRQLLSMVTEESLLSTISQVIGRREDEATLISSISGIDVFSPFVEPYDSDNNVYRVRLCDYNDFDLNNMAKILFELAVELKEKTGVDIRFINLSGGIGIAYKPDQEENDIAVIGEGVHKVYDEVLTPNGMGDVAIYTELGRFMLAPYGCLVTKAIHEKHTHKEYIGVDACAVNLMRPAMYGAYHHITVAGKEDAPCDHVYDITGSLCENNDKFAIDRKLPKIDMGDYLIIHDTGAHGFSMGYNYNGKLRSSELLLKEDGSVEMIRRAETPKDYFATFDFCNILDKLNLK